MKLPPKWTKAVDLVFDEDIPRFRAAYPKLTYVVENLWKGVVHCWILMAIGILYAIPFAVGAIIIAILSIRHLTRKNNT